jgi:isoamylase
MLLSAGVPMFNGGDEFMRSQNCNNNAYNLDSPANWLNYTLTTDQQNFRTFTQRLLAFRKAHAALRPSNFYVGTDTNGNIMEQLRWFKPDGSQADAGYFSNASNHAIAWRLDGTELGDTAKAIYVAYNGWQGAVNFTLPWTGQQAANWYRVVDTCNFAEGANQVRLPGSEDLIGPENTVYGLCDRGLLVLIAK